MIIDIQLHPFITSILDATFWGRVLFQGDVDHHILIEHPNKIHLLHSDMAYWSDAYC